MRERRSSDWVIDLNGRHGVEAQVEHAIARHETLRLLQSSVNSYDRLDFQLLGPGERLLEIEVKAKHQPLSEGWRALRPDVDPADLFVLDELALRKLTDAGRYAFLLVRDVPMARWVLWTAGDLAVASRVRHVRRLQAAGPDGAEHHKGKLLLDLNEAYLHTPRLDVALHTVCEVTVGLEHWWCDIAPWPKGRRAG